VLESVAFLLVVNVARMQQAAPLDRISISGGLSRSDYLCHTLARVSGLVVERYAVREATARGAAFLAAGEPDGWEQPAVERSFPPASDEGLTSRFTRWREEMARRGAGPADEPLARH
jgi:glycerol kinase